MARQFIKLVLQLAGLLRPDVLAARTGDKSEGEWLRLWWSTQGRLDYPAWAEVGMPTSKELLEPLPTWPSYGQFGVTAVLEHLLHQRPDLRAAFPVNTQAGQWQAIAWFFASGLREYKLLECVDAVTIEALDQTPPFFNLDTSDPSRRAPITWLMFFVWRNSAALQAAFELRTEPGQVAYLQWFFLEGVGSQGLAPLVAPRWYPWLRQSLAVGPAPFVDIPRAALLLLQRRADLQKAFDLATPQGRAGFAQWSQAAWRVEPALRWMRTAGEVERAEGTNLDAACGGQITAPTVARPFGVNLIGFAFGELGIGEDVRMAAAACEAAGVPFAVVNIEPGGQVRQADDALASRVEQSESGLQRAPFAINIFCLTGFDTARVFLEYGTGLFEGRYNIGWWPWELPVWPKAWQATFDLVDEVWAATEFTRQMYGTAQRGSETKKQVTLMPLAANVSRVKHLQRSLLGLPQDRFLFLYVFDFNSYLVRKNPLAAIQAFKQAFGPDDDTVGLALKTMNSDPQNPKWQQFVRQCASDSRIVLIDTTLDRGKVLGLINACDAYLSLHRSEGFGRTLAEAMLFGKPVVATDFSGNVDFLTQKTGYPVKWKRRSAKPGDYAFVTETDKAWWAEPEIGDAALQMRRARAAGSNAAHQKFVATFAHQQFSPLRIGQLMNERLRTIQVIRGQSGAAVSDLGARFLRLSASN